MLMFLCIKIHYLDFFYELNIIGKIDSLLLNYELVNMFLKYAIKKINITLYIKILYNQNKIENDIILVVHDLQRYKIILFKLAGNNKI